MPCHGIRSRHRDILTVGVTDNLGMIPMATYIKIGPDGSFRISSKDHLPPQSIQHPLRSGDTRALGNARDFVGTCFLDQIYILWIKIVEAFDRTDSTAAKSDNARNGECMLRGPLVVVRRVVVRLFVQKCMRCRSIERGDSARSSWSHCEWICKFFQFGRAHLYTSHRTCF